MSEEQESDERIERLQVASEARLVDIELCCAGIRDLLERYDMDETGVLGCYARVKTADDELNEVWGKLSDMLQRWADEQIAGIVVDGTMNGSLGTK